MRIRRAPLFPAPAEIAVKERIRRELELLRELSRRARAAGNRAALNLSATRRAEANMANRPGTAPSAASTRRCRSVRRDLGERLGVDFTGRAA